MLLKRFPKVLVFIVAASLCFCSAAAVATAANYEIYNVDPTDIDEDLLNASTPYECGAWFKIFNGYTETRTFRYWYRLAKIPVGTPSVTVKTGGTTIYFAQRTISLPPGNTLYAPLEDTQTFPCCERYQIEGEIEIYEPAIGDYSLVDQTVLQFNTDQSIPE